MIQFIFLYISGLQALKYQSAWGLSGKAADMISGNLIFGGTNLTDLVEFAKTGGSSLYPFEWTISDPAKADPKTGLCPSEIPHFVNDTKCVTLDPEYATKWAKVWATIEPYTKNGTILGIFLSDERMWNGATLGWVCPSKQLNL